MSYRDKAVKWFLECAKPTSFEHDRFKANAYDIDPQMIERFKPNGKFDVQNAYSLIGIEDQKFGVIKTILRLNLNETETEELIQYRYRQCYIDVLDMLKGPYVDSPGMYKNWCDEFEVPFSISFYEELKTYSKLYD